VLPTSLVGLDGSIGCRNPTLYAWFTTTLFDDVLEPSPPSLSVTVTVAV
jgi:hypothetical protein